MAYQNIYIDARADSQVVYLWDDDKGLVTMDLSQFKYAYVKDPTGKHLAMTGERVSKTKRFSRGAPEVFESDLPMETRVLTDVYLNEDTPSTGHRIFFFDIEVSMENGVPDVHDPNNEVTAISYYDPITLKYEALVLNKNKAARYNDRETEGKAVRFFDNEVNLLQAFINAYEEIAPTIITGWNSNGFDVPYIYNRMKQVLGAGQANKLSPIGKVRYSERLELYKIAGVSCLDYLNLYKKFTYMQQPNYRLDSIGRFELGYGKVEYEGSLDHLFETDIHKFIEYNLQDVRIVVELEKKLQFIELARGICHIGHVPYEDYWYSSRFLEGTIVTYLHRKNIIVKDKPPGGREAMDAHERGENKFAGAFVRVPMPGSYNWVYSLDLQSLYPSIIRSLNISPETKIGKVLNWDTEGHKNKSILAYVISEGNSDETMELEYDAFVEFMTENNLSISSNGILYTNDKRGIIPDVLETWFAQRIEFKKLAKQYAETDKEKAAYYDRRQHVQKIFLNSMYGVLGLPVFRFYDTDNAAAVTLTGQDVIKHSAGFVNDLYVAQNVEPKSKVWLDKYWDILKDDAKKRKSKENVPYPSKHDHCIYIDTDSLYFSSEPFLDRFETDAEKEGFSIKLATAVENKLNAYYDGMAKELFFCTDHYFTIKGESIARTAIWIGKKRYALDKTYDMENKQHTTKTVFKGLDVVRSSFPKAFSEFMKPLINDFLKQTPKEVVDQKILEFKKALPSMKYVDVARNTSANGISGYTTAGASMNQFESGAPAHVKAAIVYNNLLKEFKIENKYAPITDGEKIKYVILKNNPYRIEAVAFRGYMDPPQIIDLIKQYIDTDELFEKEMRNKLDDFYNAMGWGLIPTETNQNADQFFSF